MLGFFKNNKKEYEVNCPVCLREFTFKFDPDEIMKYDYNISLINKLREMMEDYE